MSAFSKSKQRDLDFVVLPYILTPLTAEVPLTAVLYTCSSSVLFHSRLSTGATFDTKTAVEGHWAVPSAPCEDSVKVALVCLHLSESFVVVIKCHSKPHGRLSTQTLAYSLQVILFFSVNVCFVSLIYLCRRRVISKSHLHFVWSLFGPFFESFNGRRRSSVQKETKELTMKRRIDSRNLLKTKARAMQ